MGCICSKGTAEEDVLVAVTDKESELNKSSNGEKDNSSVQLVAPVPSHKEEFREKALLDASSRCKEAKDFSIHKSSRRANGGGSIVPLDDGEGKDVIVERPSKGHCRWPTVDIGAGGGQLPQLANIVSVPNGAEAELVAAGWPSWLASVAGEAIKGWLPRRAESFEMLDKIGQGTYSSVYKGRDLETGKIVAIKKVRFVNMEPESVRFMAREIRILRKLDHPNVMKLECLVTARMSGSLYLVFEYMEHDLAGLAARPGLKFTEQQIKCYMQQLFLGLEHCHSRGILHRDIKGSNLLINNDGVLKIGDFGLANFYHPDQEQTLTSRVVTLWYRAPELLLGATEYGAAIDLWSAGCILAELFAGKPIMPGRTEVEQMHKIFKLCGSLSGHYMRKKKLPLATSFKSQQGYKRVLSETFKYFPTSALALVDRLLAIESEKRGSASSALRSEFFTSEPLPSDPSSLPKYPPSKELDAKLQEQARRKKEEPVKGRGPESVRRGSRDFKRATPEFIASGQSKVTSSNHKFNPKESGAGFRIEPGRRAMQNGASHSSSMVHPSAAGTWNKSGNSRNNAEVRTHASNNVPNAVKDLSASSLKDDIGSTESTTGYVRKKTRIHCSGPLMPPGGNIEDLLKEHERQIQQAVRKSRLEKSATKKNQDLTGH